MKQIGRDFPIWILPSCTLMFLLPIAPANGQAPSFTGEWRTTWGPMELAHTDNQDHGQLTHH